MTLQPDEIVEGFFEGQVIYRLLGRRSSQKLLHGVPYIPYLDMVIIFYNLITVPDYGSVFLLVTEKQRKEMGLTVRDLYRQARENTQVLLPAEFKSMQQIFRENFPFLVTREGMDLYVLTNKDQHFGAAAILYDGRLDEVGQTLGENFYVIPSSVHETLILPVSAAPGPDAIRQIICHVNASVVEEKEVLSDEVYIYERGAGTLGKCL